MRKSLVLLLFSAWIIPQIDYKVYLDMFPEIKAVAICESGINAKALNPKDTDGLPAKGILQFKSKTFYKWAKLAEIEEPNIWNPLQQIILYRWADEQGLSHHWGCYNKLAKNPTFKALYLD